MSDSDEPYRSRGPAISVGHHLGLEDPPAPPENPGLAAFGVPPKGTPETLTLPNGKRLQAKRRAG